MWIYLCIYVCIYLCVFFKFMKHTRKQKEPWMYLGLYSHGKPWKVMEFSNVLEKSLKNCPQVLEKCYIHMFIHAVWLKDSKWIEILSPLIKLLSLIHLSPLKVYYNQDFTWSWKFGLKSWKGPGHPLVYMPMTPDVLFGHIEWWASYAFSVMAITKHPEAIRCMRSPDTLPQVFILIS